MESFKHTCERDGARQGCLGRTDALRRADTSPVASRGASSRRGPGDPPPPDQAPGMRGSASRAGGRSSRELTCPVSCRIPEPRSSPSMASGGPRRRAGGKPRRRGRAACGAPHVSRPSPRPPDPAGLRTGAQTQLDSFAGQSEARSAG